MAHDVFISHSNKDKPIADAVCATLERNGIRCWVAPRDILPGMTWAEAIIDAISESRVMLLIFSDHSNRSQQVLREVQCAVGESVTILPFRIQDAPLSKAMRYFIGVPHWLDALTPPMERRIDELAEKMKALLSHVEGGRAAAAAGHDETDGNVGRGDARGAATERANLQPEPGNAGPDPENGALPTGSRGSPASFAAFVSRSADPGSTPAASDPAKPRPEKESQVIPIPASHPFASTMDAAALLREILSRCAQYHDASGEIKTAATRKLFKGVDARALREVVRGSRLGDVAQLPPVLRKIAKGIGSPPCEPLNMLIDLCMEELKLACSSADDARELEQVLMGASYDRMNPAAEVHVAVARSFFQELPLDGSHELLAGAPPEAIAPLLGRLGKIEQSLGRTVPPPLEKLIETAVAEMRAGMELLENADQIRTALLAAFCQYHDASGEIHTRTAQRVFSGLDIEKLKPALENSQVSALGNLAPILRRMLQAFGRSKPTELEQIYRLTLDELTRASPAFENAGQICAALHGAVMADNYNATVHDAARARQFFEELDLAACQRAIDNSPPGELARLLRMLARISTKLDMRQTALEPLSQSIIERLGGALGTVTNADNLKQLITGSVCEFHDASGQIYAQPALELFKLADLERIGQTLAASSATALAQLLPPLRLIRQAVGFGRCPGLERLIAATAEELQRKAPTVGNAQQLQCVLQGASMSFFSPMSEIFVAEAREFFQGLDSSALSAFKMAMRSGSDPERDNLRKEIDRLAQNVGHPPIAVLEKLRTTAHASSGRRRWWWPWH